MYIVFSTTKPSKSKDFLEFGRVFSSNRNQAYVVGLDQCEWVLTRKGSDWEHPKIYIYIGQPCGVFKGSCHCNPSQKSGTLRSNSRSRCFKQMGWVVLFFFAYQNCQEKLPETSEAAEIFCALGKGAILGVRCSPKNSGGGTTTDFSRWCFQFSPLPGGSGPIWLIYLIFIKWVGFLPSRVGNLIVFLWFCFNSKFYLLLRHLLLVLQKNLDEATMNQYMSTNPLPWRGPTRSEKNPSSWIRTSWWFPARKPVEVGSLSHYSQGFLTLQTVNAGDFWTINRYGFQRPSLGFP